MAKIVDLGVVNTGKFEVTIDGGANVSDEKRTTGFGNEKIFGFGLGTVFEVISQRFAG